jgi:hypothetical protein
VRGDPAWGLSSIARAVGSLSGGRPHPQSPPGQLSAHVLQAGAGLGLLVYGQVRPDAKKIPPALLVSSLSTDQLMTELETRPLGAVLAQARNRTVHGM